MAKLNIIGAGYEGRSKDVNASRSVNFYPEISAPGSKTIASLVGTPGLSLFSSVGSDHIRGLHVFNNLIYFVARNKLYSLSIDKTLSSQIGDDLVTVNGRIVFSDNGLAPTGGDDLIFSDGLKIYNYDVVTTTFTTIDITSHTNCFVGGYFIADSGGGKFRVSNLYKGDTWDALDVATAEASPDSLVAVENNHGELWLFGEYTTEVWYQKATGDPPFARVSGGVIDYGCAARHSIAKGNNTIVWLGTKRNNDQAQFIGVCMAQGYNVQVISPPSINYKIDNYASIDDAFAYFYTDEGHEFYVLTFPGSNATWVYDTTTGMWHERSSYKNNPYNVRRHLSNNYCIFNRRHFVGDYQTGNIYEMSSAYYDEAGDPIASFRTTDHLYDDDNLRRLYISKLQIDAESGIGVPADDVALNGVTTITAGTNPEFITSNDDFVWVTNGTSNNVTKINKKTNIVAATITVGTAPRQILYALDYVWVVNLSSGTVSKINPTTDAVDATITVGTQPTDLVSDGTYMWVSVGAANNVVRIDPATDAVAATVAVGTYPIHVLFDGTSVWATNNTSDNVSKVNITTDAVDATISVGVDPTYMAYHNYSLWVLNYTGESVSKINTITDTVTATVAIGTYPEHLIYANDAVWATCSDSKNIYKINKTTDTLDATIPIDSSPKFIVSDGNYIWVTNSGGGQISKVDPVDETEDTLVTMGNDPQHIIWDGSNLWVGDNGVAAVYKVQPYVEAASVDPKAVLTWSNDGGHTWSNDHEASMGKQGEYKKRIIWRRLGYARDRVFRVMISDPVKKVLIGQYAELVGEA